MIIKKANFRAKPAANRGDWGKSGHGVSWSNLCTAYTVG